jgi:hypothetical protein
VKEVWQGMQKIARYSKKDKVCKLHDFKDECNTVLRSGNFSDLAVQSACIIPVQKQVTVSCLNDYRPKLTSANIDHTTQLTR